jgi:serine/threonine protein kinase
LIFRQAVLFTIYYSLFTIYYSLSMLAPETILQDRYRILRQLGQGGMGAVYEALDLRLDATVALKETLFVDEKLRKQFEREARLLARLHHPALPRVSDHFAEGEGAFLVMQFIGGDDLAEMITRRRGPFPQEQVLLWADQLLDALDYLHTQDPQIIHRDIKPQNLKLSSRGQIILLDFGLAKGQAGEFSRATTSASIFGYTPNYAPLEQVQGLGTDPRSDIYALAATLYHFLTGIKPPDALTRAAAIVNGQPDPLQRADEVNPAVGGDVAAVLTRGMAQNRDQRYTTAAEMRSALHTGEASTISTRGEADTVLFPSASSSTIIGAPAPTIANRATVQSGESTVVRPPQLAPQIAPQLAPKRRALPLLIAFGVLLLAAVGVGAFFAFERRNTPSQQPTPSPAPSLQVVQPSPTTSEGKRTVAAKTSDEPEKKETVKKEAKKGAKEDAASKEDKANEREAAEEARQAREEAERERRQRDQTPPAPGRDAPRPPDATELPGPNGGRRFPNVRTKTLPDGTKVMITPNGTRVITSPDGTTRVVPPADQRPGRGRRRP